jgi:transcription antitermination factor NusG
MTIALDKNPPQLFPDDLLTQDDSLGKWRIARTKSRREKALAEFLARSNIGYYLPLVKKRQPGKKRERYSLVPIFSGYLFFKSSDMERYHAFTSNHIAGVIDVADEKQLLRELLQVRKAITLDAPVYPYDFVRDGDLVEIARGPFKGLQGVIQRKTRNYRLVLNVTGLFQALALDIEAHLVEPLTRTNGTKLAR